MTIKVSNPYGADDKYKSAPETTASERSQASGKAVARFPHKPLMPEQSNGEAGKLKGKNRAWGPTTGATGS